MWTIHTVVTAGYLLDLILTGLIGTIAFALAYLAVGLAPAEKREVRKVVAKLRETRS
jgi:hypothetical protein